MIVTIPIWIVLIVKWCLLIGILAGAIGLLIAGMAALFESRHRAHEFYKRSLTYYHLIIKGKDKFNNESLDALSRLLRWRIGESPEDADHLRRVILQAEKTKKVKS